MDPRGGARRARIVREQRGLQEGGGNVVCVPGLVLHTRCNSMVGCPDEGEGGVAHSVE